MKVIFIVAGVFMSLFLYEAQSIASQKSLIYEYYAKDNDNVEKQYVRIEDYPGGQKLFKRSISGDNYTQEEQFVLGVDYETQNWKIARLDEDTDYSGEQKDNELFIKGMIKGKKVNRIIKLDDKPFYYTPKFNLSRFVLSDSQRIKFWMLRKDKLTKYLMQAKKIGQETVVVNAQEIDTVKVYCSATGLAEKFYKRIYFFRKSDGLFVRKQDPDGYAATAVLISEK